MHEKKELLNDRFGLGVTNASNAIGLSPEWTNKTRKEDMRRKEQGEEPLGPKWVKVGSRVIYPVEELKRFIDRLMEEQWGTATGKQEGKNGASNSKYQTPSS